MRSADYVPQRIEEISQVLNLLPKDERKLRRLLRSEVASGRIAQIKNQRFALPRDVDLISGQILFRQSGSARLVPFNERGNPEGDAYHVSAEDTWVSMHGDSVLTRINRDDRREPKWKKYARKGQRDRRDQTPSVRVIEILKRNNPTLTGELARSRAAFYVIPDDPRINPDILVEDPHRSKLKKKPKTGDKVIVKLHPWEQRHLNPTGEIIEVLGKSTDPFAEYKAILHKYDLNPDFPPDVMQEVESIPPKVQDNERKGRKDIRQLSTITIDPDDAKDFDDALSLEALKNGNFRVGIHIADVSAYVKPGTALMKEAKHRGNSTYLVGRVIPMLPHALSNGICSLVEAEDRLTKSVFLTFDSKRRIVNTEFANTVIRSRKRLTYKQALAFLEKDSLDEIKHTPLPPKHQTGSTGRDLKELTHEELQALKDQIRKLWTFAEAMRTRRMKKGSLDLDMPEVKIYVDEQGYADRIVRSEHDISHQLIEEYMLAANEAVARTLKSSDIPALYRVHDAPDPEKLDELRQYMATLDIPTGDLNETQNMTSLLRMIKDHPQGYTLRIHVLRSLKQACYRSSADGHYGLQKKDYTHFTSPIRRFSDLVVHQQFDRYLKRTKNPTAPHSIPSRNNPKTLLSLGEHLSITERVSQDAERESVKTKLLEFFDREVKSGRRTPFEAVIMEVKNHGMFVELTESMAYGMIHISSVRDDIYHLSADGTALVGRRSQRLFEEGSRIQVYAERVDRFKRQIDFGVLPDER